MKMISLEVKEKGKGQRFPPGVTKAVRKKSSPMKLHESVDAEDTV